MVLQEYLNLQLFRRNKWSFWWYGWMQIQSNLSCGTSVMSDHSSWATVFLATVRFWLKCTHNEWLLDKRNQRQHTFFTQSLFSPVSSAELRHVLVEHFLSHSLNFNTLLMSPRRQHRILYDGIFIQMSRLRTQWMSPT